jgi:hypothetical protein
VHNSGSSSVPTTGEDPLFRLNIKDLLTLVGGCMERVLDDPAVMGAAQQPAAWMPEGIYPCICAAL